jgi:hypothetical protein
MNQISNLQFIATLLHLKPSMLTYTEVLTMLQHWRGKPFHIKSANGNVRSNFYGTQYLSHSPKRGGIYKHVTWESTDRKYHLLPAGSKYIVPADTIEDLLEQYQFKGA